MNKYFKSIGLYALVFLIILAGLAYTGASAAAGGTAGIYLRRLIGRNGKGQCKKP